MAIASTAIIALVVVILLRHALKGQPGDVSRWVGWLLVGKTRTPDGAATSSTSTATDPAPAPVRAAKGVARTATGRGRLSLTHGLGRTLVQDLPVGMGPGIVLGVNGVAGMVGQ